MTPIVGGIFVGGASTRMMRRPKGLLPSPEGGTLVDRCCAVLRAAGVSKVVLLGAHPAYAAVAHAAALEVLDDQPRGIGPLGGLLALLKYAGDARALAVACDMPFVSAALLAQLVHAPEAPIVAPRRSLRWEPLCARYDAARVLPMAQARSAARDYSLQRLLEGAGATALALPANVERELDDWDTPEDVAMPR